MAFTDTSGFSLQEDVLAKLRRSSFVTGRDPGPETTRAVIEAGLNVGARRESEQANRVAALNAAEDDRRLRESQFNQAQAFNRRESEKQRSSEFKGGIAQAAVTVGGFGILKWLFK